MSDGPFAVDPAIAGRRSSLVAELGTAFDSALADARAAGDVDARHPRAVIPATVVATLVRDLRLGGVEEAMLLAIEPARAIARPPVSGYRVGAVGLTAPGGDLLLGGNLELPGAAIWQTVHAEGFVTLLARARGERLTTLAISQARPCGHCRQVLAEVTGAHGGTTAGDGLRLVDPAGHVLRLADVYPWPFAPADLGAGGMDPAADPWPDLRVGTAAVPAAVADALALAGRRSHAPYSGTPAAVALRLRDGAIVTGAVLESVAFNPTIGPVQDALVGLVAAGREPDEVDAAWLGVPRAARVGHEGMARDALAAAAPAASLRVTYWA